MKKLMIASMMISLIAVLLPVYAADLHHTNHSAETTLHHKANAQVDPVSKSAFDEVMTKMHDTMRAMPVSGDVDIDFVRGMIPHHQAAIDMATIELAKGKDPVNLRLARDIITTQEKEIAAMRAWLAKHDVR